MYTTSLDFNSIARGGDIECHHVFHSATAINSDCFLITEMWSFWRSNISSELLSVTELKFTN
jgi:hypothetical protein